MMLLRCLECSAELSLGMFEFYFPVLPWRARELGPDVLFEHQCREGGPFSPAQIIYPAPRLPEDLW
jgi:hypothetical protein